MTSLTVTIHLDHHLQRARPCAVMVPSRNGQALECPTTVDEAVLQEDVNIDESDSDSESNKLG